MKQDINYFPNIDNIDTKTLISAMIMSAIISGTLAYGDYEQIKTSEVAKLAIDATNKLLSLLKIDDKNQEKS